MIGYKDRIVEYVLSEYRKGDDSISDILSTMSMADDDGEFINESFVSNATLVDFYEAVVALRFLIEDDVTVVVNLSEESISTDCIIGLNSLKVEDCGKGQHSVSFMTEKEY